jgi:hypothetical protein
LRSADRASVRSARQYKSAASAHLLAKYKS